jgi:hypothetical protein
MHRVTMARAPRYIKGIDGRGYLVIGRVEVLQPDEQSWSSVTPTTVSYRNSSDLLLLLSRAAPNVGPAKDPATRWLRHRESALNAWRIGTPRRDSNSRPHGS